MPHFLFAIITGLGASVILSVTQGLVYAYQPLPYEWLSFLDTAERINKITVYALLQYFIASFITLGSGAAIVGLTIKHQPWRYAAITCFGAIIIFIGTRARFVNDYTWQQIFPFGWQHPGEVVIILGIIFTITVATHKLKRYFGQ